VSNVAAKINRLFEVMHRRGEDAMSTDAAAQSISTQTGVEIGGAYLRELRAGTVTTPSVAELRAIATFFGFSPEYLTDDRPDIEDQLTLLELMRDSPRVFNCRRLE